MWEEVTDYLAIEQCKPGYLYRILARNGHVGIYDIEHRGYPEFTLSRHKFGENYTFPEDHWDTGEPYGTAKPVEELEQAPTGMDEAATLAYLNGWEAKLKTR